MIEPYNRHISVKWQCDLLGLNRSTLYYKPIRNRTIDMALREAIVALFIDKPFFGRRRMSVHLMKKKGIFIPFKRMGRLMKELGLHAIYPKRWLSQPARKFQKAPYYLGDLKLSGVNQAWATDITYIRLPGGFVFLTAVMDLFSRYILSYRISNTLDPRFCVECLEEAIGKYGAPFLFNTDQGSQFTGEDFSEVLKKNNVIISMDGKGRALDNVLVERFWRSIKYEGIFPMAFETIQQLTEGIKNWIRFYNEERCHQSLAYRTPEEVFFGREEFGISKAA